MSEQPAKCINILHAIADEIIVTFKLAEETHFQEKGKKWPYSVQLQMHTGFSTCRIHVLQRPHTARVEPFSEVVKRLLAVAEEVIDSTMFDVDVDGMSSMTTGSIMLEMKT